VFGICLLPVALIGSSSIGKFLFITHYKLICVYYSVSLICLSTIVSVVTGVTFSPTSEFIATSHADNVGIFLWANKSYFGSVYLDQPLVKPYKMHLPLPSSFNEVDVDDLSVSMFASLDNSKSTDIVEVVDAVIEEQENVDDSVVPLTKGAITLSGIARSKWNTLDSLDLIRERNKPTEAPKEPEKVCIIIIIFKSWL
jgi:U3 small nucleolar RNA-associated protein 21